MKQSKTHFMQKIIVFSSLFLAFNQVHAEEVEPLNIYTVNYPVKFFAESIAGQYAKVTLPMPTDIDPAFWSPKAEDIASLQKADMILLNGANYAKWLPKVSLPLFKLVNTSSEFREAYIALNEGVTHNHGTGGKHSHTGTAFTTWLDFSLAEKQAKSIFKALSRKQPKLNASFVQNFIPLQEALLGLDSELIEIGKVLNGKALLASHPVYQYMRKRYQLNLESVHWEPEEAPTEGQWGELKELIAQHPAKWMLWEGVPAVETVSKLEELGIKSIVFTPVANSPETGDFLSIMHENIARLKTIIKE
ncbi:MAG: zinc ABC transporter solute-binding protein [Methylococcaceae bacterium]|nr:zinc ABC transporter solute-binding protein [Methylococcaceae bacterium]